MITAAASIMILVFASFALGDDRIIKLFGIGLASAVFFDAVIIRCLLVPALMEIFGRRAWWLPVVAGSPAAAPGDRGAARAPPVGDRRARDRDDLSQSSRRSAAQRESSWRLESWSLRSTADTWASTVLAEMPSRSATSLYM